MNKPSNIGRINALINQGMSICDAVEVILNIQHPVESEPNLIELLMERGYSRHQAIEIALSNQPIIVGKQNVQN